MDLKKLIRDFPDFPKEGILVSVQYQHDLKIIQKVLDSFFVQIWKFYIGIIVCHKSMMCAL